MTFRLPRRPARTASARAQRRRLDEWTFLLRRLVICAALALPIVGVDEKPTQGGVEATTGIEPV